MEPFRPPVSRETRLLLTIVLISLSMLWVLARIRFPGRSSTPNPVAPVLAQLAPPSALEDIASAVAQLTPRLEGNLTPVELVPPAGVLAPRSGRDVVPALRVREGIAVALTDRPVAAEPAAAGIQLTARDSASQLTIFRVAPGEARDLSIWSPRGLQYPRFLIAADVSRDGTSLRPVFIGSLDSVVSPLWDGPIWAAPERADLHKGAFVFTVEGEFAGLVIERDGRPAIVPGAVVVATADRVVQQSSRPAGWIGVEVQPLTEALASAVGVRTGALVAWVDPRGPASELLSARDVVEQIDGAPVVTSEVPGTAGSPVSPRAIRSCSPCGAVPHVARSGWRRVFRRRRQHDGLSGSRCAPSGAPASRCSASIPSRRQRAPHSRLETSSPPRMISKRPRPRNSRGCLLRLPTQRRCCWSLPAARRTTSFRSRRSHDAPRHRHHRRRRTA